MLRPRQGDRQGESGVAQRFVLSVDPSLETWCAATRDADDVQHLTRLDPWTGMPRCATHVQYADDTARVGMATAIDKLTRKALFWDASLGAALAPLGISQNRSNFQLLCQLTPNSVSMQTQLDANLRELALHTNRVDIATHLGCQHVCV